MNEGRVIAARFALFLEMHRWAQAMVNPRAGIGELAVRIRALSNARRRYRRALHGGSNG